MAPVKSGNGGTQIGEEQTSTRMISMVETIREASPDSHAWASSLVRPLVRRYLLVLVSVAGLVLIDQAILQPLLMQLNFYAPVINLAGRQRMLSQKVTKEVLALSATTDPDDREFRRAELFRALDQWTGAHRALLDGDPAKGIRPVASSVSEVIRQIEPSFESIRHRATEIAQQEAGPTSITRNDEVTALLLEEPIYLHGMEKAVGILEASARSQIAWLRGFGFALMTIALLLLVGVYFVVLGPAARLIHSQVERLSASDRRHRQLAEMLRQAHDQLELRVAERTSELSSANDALAREMLERQAAELRMRELSSELAHVSRVTSLGQLATGLAHEINQPLATVANYAGTLELTLERDRPSDKESYHLVVQMKQAALRAGAIVRSIRNFVRGDTLQTSRVELNELVLEVTELCRPEMLESNVKWTLELSPIPVLIIADSLQIQQVVVNFIQNALHAMESSNTDCRHLTIRTEVNRDEAKLLVIDTGPGFVGEALEKCFHPFYSTKPEGLGMGLAICRTIIEQHHGRVWCENLEGGGAIVAFELPLAPKRDVEKA